MAKTIRIYADGSGTPLYTQNNVSDGPFSLSVPMSGLSAGSHYLEATAQEMGPPAEIESNRVRVPVVGDPGQPGAQDDTFTVTSASTPAYRTGSAVGLFTTADPNGDVNLTLGVTTQPGDLVVVFLVGPGDEAAGSFTTPTDTYANTWSTNALADYHSGANDFVQAWWTVIPNTAGKYGANHHVIASGANWNDHFAVAAVFTGVSAATPFHTGAAISSTATDPIQPSVTTTVANELLVSIVATVLGSNAVNDFTSGTGYTEAVEYDAVGVGTISFEYRVAASTGAFGGDWTRGISQNVVAMQLAFNPA